MHRQATQLHEPCTNVVLVQKLSHLHCGAKVSFGCIQGTPLMYVRGGCRGLFRCNGGDVVPCGHGGQTTNARQRCLCFKRNTTAVNYNASPSTEAHVIYVYGDSAHACGAAVHAENLASADPSRKRLALAWDISNETRRILSHGWAVREVRPPAISGAVGRKAALLDCGGLGGKFSRVMAWDADHFVFPRTTHLQRLWAASPKADMVASPELKGCFNGGLLMYRPSSRRRWEYEQLLATHVELSPDREKVKPPGRCPGLDQPYLNAVFSASNYIVRQIRSRAGYNASPKVAFIGPETFRVRTPRTLLGASYVATCPKSASQLERSADSFHFYGRTPPWGVGCAVCAMQGRQCNSKLLQAAGIDGRCVHSVAVDLWYSSFLRLPAEIRALCHKRVSTSADRTTGCE